GGGVGSGRGVLRSDARRSPLVRVLPAAPPHRSPPAGPAPSADRTPERTSCTFRCYFVVRGNRGGIRLSRAIRPARWQGVARKGGRAPRCFFGSPGTLCDLGSSAAGNAGHTRPPVGERGEFRKTPECFGPRC